MLPLEEAVEQPEYILQPLTLMKYRVPAVSGMFRSASSEQKVKIMK